jgi:hypothetical protein
MNEALDSIPPSLKILHAWNIYYEAYFSNSQFHFPLLEELVLGSKNFRPQYYRLIAVGCPNLMKFSIGTQDEWAPPQNRAGFLEAFHSKTPSPQNAAESFNKEASYQPAFHFTDKMEWLTVACGHYGDELVATLPRSLTFLTLLESPHINDVTIEHHIKHMPFLRTLSSSSSAITGSSFVHLPRQLAHLSLHSSTRIDDDEIHFLPHGLEYLCLVQATSLTDECGPALPPRLAFLYLAENRKVTRAILRHLDYKYAMRVITKAFCARWCNGSPEITSTFWKLDPMHTIFGT